MPKCREPWRLLGVMFGRLLRCEKSEKNQFQNVISREKMLIISGPFRFCELVKLKSKCSKISTHYPNVTIRFNVSSPGNSPTDESGSFLALQRTILYLVFSKDILWIIWVVKTWILFTYLNGENDGLRRMNYQIESLKLGLLFTSFCLTIPYWPW